MRKFRAKQAVLVVVFKAKAVYYSSKSEENVFNPILTSNFTFITTKQCCPTLLLVKMSRATCIGTVNLNIEWLTIQITLIFCPSFELFRALSHLQG